MDELFIVLLVASLMFGIPLQGPSTAQPAQAAQDSQRAQDGSDVVVQSFAWGVTHQRARAQDSLFSASTGGMGPSAMEDSAISTNSPANTPPRSRRPLPSPPVPVDNSGRGTENVEVSRETYVQLRNSGSRVVKAVSWDYVFFTDQSMEHEVKRYKFRTRKRIAPGEVKFLSESVERGADSPYQRVIINRVEFTDGSVWQRP